MQRFLLALSVTTMMTLLAGPASAQVTPAAGFTPPDDTQSIGVGAVIFYDYTLTNSPKAARRGRATGDD